MFQLLKWLNNFYNRVKWSIFNLMDRAPIRSEMLLNKKSRKVEQSFRFQSVQEVDIESTGNVEVYTCGRVRNLP